MSVTYTNFTAAFPEFADATKFPQATVQFWLDQSAHWLSSKRFSANQIDLAAMLYTAHNVSMAFVRARAAAAGQAPGVVTGMTANKSVDKLSIGYMDNNQSIPGAGIWNATTYGQQLYKMMQQVGTFTFARRLATRNPRGVWG